MKSRELESMVLFGLTERSGPAKLRANREGEHSRWGRQFGRFSRLPVQGWKGRTVEQSRPDENLPPLVFRAYHAWRRRGPRYAWHKTLRRTLGRWPTMKRKFLYADPQEYWSLRGGLDYFREQEGQEQRTQRAEWMARRLARYRPTSILEVGCGYGKQIRTLRANCAAPITGVDFSPSQLTMAQAYLEDVERVDLALATGTRLPFPDNSFDLVLTSAVILHNAPPLAEAIRREVIRVARRFAAHNEDLDVTYNRYGYDTAAWYATQGIPLLEVGPIPSAPYDSQFCVAELCRP